ncbi:MAG: hypothetical protein MPN21_03665 [Thermoanaerobaculia bacterium]|nr:hypothetical protein [Thermoanaerobaculia bacterium]
MVCDNTAPPVTLQLDCPALPNTVASGQMQSSSAGEVLDYDLFAWNSFIALNWPAIVPSAANGYRRGFPDTSRSFAAAQAADLTVWETLKEKREIFLADPFTGEITPDPQVSPWNAAPVYGPADQQVPLCEDVKAQDLAMSREIVFAVKGNLFDTQDETAEVASEARETDAVLCKGHDPNCGISGTAVGPRVWKGQPNDQGVPVVYEVKVNWDFYDYLQNFEAGPLWNQPIARQAATRGDIRLPARTSAGEAAYVPAGSHVSSPASGQQVRGPNPLVAGYSAESCLTGSRETPCPVGSIHLKAAWLPISEADADSGKYHVAEAFYYRNSGAEKCRAPQLFGLIGLHIIQRIHQQEFEGGQAQEPARPAGGTFVFATWEHVDNDEQGLTYANLGPTQFDGEPVDDPMPYPNVDAGEDAIDLRRVYDLLPSTKAANQLVHDALGCSGSQPSVWCNYELIGTQYRATNLPSPAPTLLTVIPDQPLPNVESPAGSGQPYYLANLVIESNLGLQQFQGVPPAFAPVAHFTSPKPPPGTSGRTRGQGGGAPEILANSDDFHFQHGYNNLAWRIAPRVKDAEPKSDIDNNGGTFAGSKRGAFNMGGCMGCHGVAQTQGYSFSFVLLDNQAGGSPDTQTEVVIPPLPLGAE